MSDSANAAIQPVAAEVLGSFAKVFQGYYTLVVAGELQKKDENGEIIPPITADQIKEQAEKAAKEKVANDQIKAGESLGSFSFVATGE